MSDKSMDSGKINTIEFGKFIEWKTFLYVSSIFPVYSYSTKNQQNTDLLFWMDNRASYWQLRHKINFFETYTKLVMDHFVHTFLILSFS